MLDARMTFYYAQSDVSDADVIVIGMPLDRTSSFASGSRFGPDIARLGADNVETFSPYLRRDTARLRIYDAGNIQFSFATPLAPLELITTVTKSHYDAHRRQVAIGGEHTITVPIVTELARRYPDLCVIQYDAHSDLRDEFLGEVTCHATAMRRVLDVIPRSALFQLGVRSFSRPEEMSEQNLFPFDVAEPTRSIVGAIGSRPVYVTLDVDVLDPGTMPDVQTPEPGGCQFRELVHSLALLADLNVVGADLVEVCPRTVQPSTGAVVAAELVRELVLLVGGRS